jgi:hypothetical protein
MVSPGSDDAFPLEEIAPVVGIPAPTLFKWRQRGQVLTRYDFEVDPDIMQRILRSLREGRAGQPLAGTMPLAKFFLEDAVRMLIISRLSAAGFDRIKLLKALGWPYAIHIDPGREPRFLVIFPEGEKLDRLPKDTKREVQEVLAKKPFAHVVDLDAYRAEMLSSFAELVKQRDERAEALRNRPRELGRFVAVPKD